MHKEVAENRRVFDLQKEAVAKLQSQLVELKVKRETDQLTQKNVVSTVQNKIDDLQETRTLGVAVRSIKPTGPRKIVVLALSGFIGVIGGVILAFFSEFVSAVRRVNAPESE